MIQSLRKEKGGYALLYVMVVVMVLCAISMMICTVALRSLQSQEASRMSLKKQGKVGMVK